VGRHRQALATAHRLLRLGARGAPVLAAWTVLLETLRATRRFAALKRWGTQLLEQGTGPVERAIAAYELALAELEAGRSVERALELAHSSLALIPRSCASTARGARRIHLARKEYSDAVDYLEQAAALSESPAILNPTRPRTARGRGGSRAREVLQRARHGGPQDLKTDVLTHLARVGWLSGHGRRKE